MALVPAPAPGGKLAQWGLTRESSLDEYWEQAAVHCYSRSEKMQAAARQMPDAFLDLFGTSTVDMMLALTEGQVEKALEAGGLSPNHIQALEYSCGHKFRSLHGAPDSAAIVKTVTISKESKHDTTSKFDSRKEPSLGWLLTQRGYSTEKLPVLPASVLLAAEDTEDPSTTEISHNDAKRVVAETRKWILCDFKKVNYDKPGRELIAASLTEAFPSIPARNGVPKSWFTKLGNAGNNSRNHGEAYSDDMHAVDAIDLTSGAQDLINKGLKIKVKEEATEPKYQPVDPLVGDAPHNGADVSPHREGAGEGGAGEGGAGEGGADEGGADEGVWAGTRMAIVGGGKGGVAKGGVAKGGAAKGGAAKGGAAKGGAAKDGAAKGGVAKGGSGKGVGGDAACRKPSRAAKGVALQKLLAMPMLPPPTAEEEEEEEDQPISRKGGKRRRVVQDDDDDEGDFSVGESGDDDDEGLGEQGDKEHGGLNAPNEKAKGAEKVPSKEKKAKQPKQAEKAEPFVMYLSGTCPVRAVAHDDVIVMTAPASGNFDKRTIIGTYLACPIDFFYDDLSMAPDIWGYIGKVLSGARADQPCLRVQFHDGVSEFYLNEHPKFLANEKHRYLNNPNVKVVGVGVAAA